MTKSSAKSTVVASIVDVCDADGSFWGWKFNFMSKLKRINKLGNIGIIMGLNTKQ